jgi:hypothetical protein
MAAGKTLAKLWRRSDPVTASSDNIARLERRLAELDLELNHGLTSWPASKVRGHSQRIAGVRRELDKLRAAEAKGQRSA